MQRGRNLRCDSLQPAHIQKCRPRHHMTHLSHSYNPNSTLKSSPQPRHIVLRHTRPYQHRSILESPQGDRIHRQSLGRTHHILETEIRLPHSTHYDTHNYHRKNLSILRPHTERHYNNLQFVDTNLLLQDKNLNRPSFVHLTRHSSQWSLAYINDSHRENISLFVSCQDTCSLGLQNST